MDEMSWPTSGNGKVVHCIVIFNMSNLHYNWWETRKLLKVIINPPLEVPPLGYGWIYKILFGQNPNIKQCKITIRNFLACTCLDFVTMIFGLSGRRGKCCFINTSIMFYNMSCFVGISKVSSIF